MTKTICSHLIRYLSTERHPCSYREGERDQGISKLTHMCSQMSKWAVMLYIYCISDTPQTVEDTSLKDDISHNISFSLFEEEGLQDYQFPLCLYKSLGYSKLLSVFRDPRDSYLIRGRTPAGLTSQGFCQNRENYINVNVALRWQWFVLHPGGGYGHWSRTWSLILTLTDWKISNPSAMLALIL